MKRRETRKVKIGNIYIRRRCTSSVQSMTNTDTRDVNATVSQIKT